MPENVDPKLEGLDDVSLDTIHNRVPVQPDVPKSTDTPPKGDDDNNPPAGDPPAGDPPANGGDGNDNDDEPTFIIKDFTALTELLGSKDIKDLSPEETEDLVKNLSNTLAKLGEAVS